MKAFQRIINATCIKEFQVIRSTTDEKADQRKTGKVENRVCCGTKKKWATDRKNEVEAMEF